MKVNVSNYNKEGRPVVRHQQGNTSEKRACKPLFPQAKKKKAREIARRFVVKKTRAGRTCRCEADSG